MQYENVCVQFFLTFDLSDHVQCMAYSKQPHQQANLHELFQTNNGLCIS